MCIRGREQRQTGIQVDRYKHGNKCVWGYKMFITDVNRILTKSLKLPTEGGWGEVI